MQCSCGGSTSTAQYQRTAIQQGTGGRKIREYGTQEICQACGRATTFKIVSRVEIPVVARAKRASTKQAKEPT